MGKYEARFDEFLVLVSKAYGWQVPYYVKKHVTKNRPQKQDISSDALRSIERYNELDIALYQDVAEKFEKLVKQQGAALEKAMKRLRLLNKVYTFSRPVFQKVR